MKGSGEGREGGGRRAGESFCSEKLGERGGAGLGGGGGRPLALFPDELHKLLDLCLPIRVRNDCIYKLVEFIKAALEKVKEVEGR